MPSARLPAFDYGRGAFFVTAVTAGRVPWFGGVEGGVVVPSWAGGVAAEEWERTGVVRPAVTVDAFVAMPDHVHGVLWIEPDAEPDVETPRRGVSGSDRGGSGGHPPAWRPGVLGAVIGRYKSECTRRIRQRHPEFAWQPRFWDVVIRDARHLAAARNYIADNPAHWRP